MTLQHKVLTAYQDPLCRYTIDQVIEYYKGWSNQTYFHMLQQVKQIEESHPENKKIPCCNNSLSFFFVGNGHVLHYFRNGFTEEIHVQFIQGDNCVPVGQYTPITAPMPEKIRKALLSCMILPTGDTTNG